jgi:hypothetical protein
MDDNFGDWRSVVLGTLKDDVPAAFPGGPSHKAGSIIYSSCLVQTDDGRNIGFALPSSTAMALNIAILASKKADELRGGIVYKKVVTPNGLGFSVSNESMKSLYDFFEQSMITVTFSFQALEIFCNHMISRKLKSPLEIKRRKKKESMLPDEIERLLSTEDKLSQVLPKIKGIPTPKGKKQWESFKVLKNARDSTIHLKSLDQRVVDKDSLFFQFLNRKAGFYPNASIEMIKFFTQDAPPRWLNLLDS